MQQTPVHEFHNPDLLAFVPTSASRLIEVGCSSGSLAREFKKLSPGSEYVGIDIDSMYVDLAKRHCDAAMVLDLETASEQFWADHSGFDCWIFGDTLEHFRDPWSVLKNVRQGIAAGGSVVACIPNAQHWSLQVKLSTGNFRYADQGLMDRTHLRWFTRQTMLEMFRDTGFKVVAGKPRVFQEKSRDEFLPLIRAMAHAAGVNPDQAVQDAIPLQYVLRAVPV